MPRAIRRFLRPIALAVGLTFLGSNVGCGYILYPERRGNPGHVLDVTVLVLDLLWLLPGVIPGLVALAIDLGSGALYYDRDRQAYLLKPEGRLTVKVPALRRGAQLELRLVSDSGRVLGRDGRTLAAGQGTALSIDLAAAKRVAASEGTRSRAVELQLLHGRNGRRARLPLELL